MTSLWLLVNLAAVPVARGSATINNTDKGSIVERVTTLERISTNQAQLIQQLQQQLNASQNDIDLLRNSIQQNTYQLNQAIERQKQLYLKLDSTAPKEKVSAKPEQSESMLTPSSSAKVRDQTEGSAAGKNKLSAIQSENANKDYNAAMELILVNKQYDKAIAVLQTWVKRYPQSTYQPNANYWLGQLYYTKKQLDQASYYFATVVKNFPSSPKASEALLKVGEIFQRQKQLDKAREIYQQVITRYANTSSAKTAAGRLHHQTPLSVLNLMD